LSPLWKDIKGSCRSVYQLIRSKNISSEKIVMTVVCGSQEESILHSEFSMWSLR
jgi:hypothetical protein